MTLKTARLANLLLASLLVGNEVGGRTVVHPALDALPAPAQIAAEREVYRRYGRVMPIAMNLATFSALPVLSRIPDRRSPAFRWTLSGLACFVAMLAVTLAGNLPINRRILTFPPDGSPAQFRALRRRWDRLHTVRVALDVAGLSFLCLGALSRPEAAPSPSPVRTVSKESRPWIRS